MNSQYSSPASPGLMGLPVTARRSLAMSSTGALTPQQHRLHGTTAEEVEAAQLAELQRRLKQKWGRVMRRMANLPTSGTTWRPVLPLGKIGEMKAFFKMSNTHSNRGNDNAASEGGRRRSSTAGKFSKLSDDEDEERQHDNGPNTSSGESAGHDGFSVMDGFGQQQQQRRVRRRSDESTIEDIDAAPYAGEGLFEGDEDDNPEIDEETFIDRFGVLLQKQRPSRAELREWFRDIDINIDGSVSWQEFTSYIVEQSRRASDGMGMGRARRFAPVVNPDVALPKWNSVVARMATIDRGSGGGSGGGGHSSASVVAVAHDGFMRIWDPITCQCRLTINNAANSPSLRLRQTVAGLSAPTHAGCTDVVLNARNTHCFVSGTDKAITVYEVGEDDSYSLSRQYLGVTDPRNTSPSSFSLGGGSGDAGGDGSMGNPSSLSSNTQSIVNALKASNITGGSNNAHSRLGRNHKRGGGGSTVATSSNQKMVDTTVLNAMPEIPTSIDVTSHVGGREVLYVAQHTGSVLLYPTMRLSRVSEVDPIATLRPHSQRITKVRYVPHLKGMLTASWDASLVVTDVETGMPTAVMGGQSVVATMDGDARDMSLRGHVRLISDFVYSPQQRLIASCGGDRGVMLWSAGMSCPVAVLEGHSASLISLAVDGSTLMSLDVDNVLKIWDLRTHKMLQSINTALGADSDEAGNSSPNANNVVQTSCVAYHSRSRTIVACGRQTLFYSGGGRTINPQTNSNENSAGGAADSTGAAFLTSNRESTVSTVTSSIISSGDGSQSPNGSNSNRLSSARERRYAAELHAASSSMTTGHSEAIAGFAVVDSADTIVSTDSVATIGWNAANGRSRVSWEAAGGTVDGGAGQQQEDSEEVAWALANSPICGITTDMAERKAILLLAGGEVVIFNHRNAQRLAFIDPKRVFASATAKPPPSFHLPLTKSADPRAKLAVAGGAASDYYLASLGSTKKSSSSSAASPFIGSAMGSAASQKARLNDLHTNPPLQVAHISNGENTAKYIIVLYSREFHCIDELVGKVDQTSAKARAMIQRFTIEETQRGRGHPYPHQHHQNTTSAAATLNSKGKAGMVAALGKKNGGGGLLAKKKEPVATTTATSSASATVGFDADETFTVMSHLPAIGKITCGNLLVGTSRGRLLIFSPVMGQFLSKLEHPLIKATLGRRVSNNENGSSPIGGGGSAVTPSLSLAATASAGALLLPPIGRSPLSPSPFGGGGNGFGGTTPSALLAATIPSTPATATTAPSPSSPFTPSTRPVEDLVILYHHDLVATVLGDSKVYFWDLRRITMRGYARVPCPLLCLAGPSRSSAPSPFSKAAREQQQHDAAQTAVNSTAAAFVRGGGGLRGRTSSQPPPSQRQHHSRALSSSAAGGGGSSESFHHQQSAGGGLGRMDASTSNSNCNGLNSTGTGGGPVSTSASATFLTLGDVLDQSAAGAGPQHYQTGNGGGGLGVDSNVGAFEGSASLRSFQRGGGLRGGAAATTTARRLSMTQRPSDPSSPLSNNHNHNHRRMAGRRSADEGSPSYTTSVLVAGDDSGSVLVFDTTPLGLPSMGSSVGGGNGGSHAAAMVAPEGVEIVLPLLCRFRVSDAPLHSIGYASGLKLIYCLTTGGQGVAAYSRYGDYIGDFGQRQRWNVRFKNTFKKAAPPPQGHRFIGRRSLGSTFRNGGGGGQSTIVSSSGGGVPLVGGGGEGLAVNPNFNGFVSPVHGSLSGIGGGGGIVRGGGTPSALISPSAVMSTVGGGALAGGGEKEEGVAVDGAGDIMSNSMCRRRPSVAAGAEGVGAPTILAGGPHHAPPPPPPPPPLPLPSDAAPPRLAVSTAGTPLIPALLSGNAGGVDDGGDGGGRGNQKVTLAASLLLLGAHSGNSGDMPPTARPTQHQNQSQNTTAVVPPSEGGLLLAGPLLGAHASPLSLEAHGGGGGGGVGGGGGGAGPSSPSFGRSLSGLEGGAAVGGVGSSGRTRVVTLSTTLDDANDHDGDGGIAVTPAAAAFMGRGGLVSPTALSASFLIAPSPRQNSQGSTNDDDDDDEAFKRDAMGAEHDRSSSSPSSPSSSRSNAMRRRASSRPKDVRATLTEMLQEAPTTSATKKRAKRRVADRPLVLSTAKAVARRIGGGGGASSSPLMSSSSGGGGGGGVSGNGRSSQLLKSPSALRQQQQHNNTTRTSSAAPVNSHDGGGGGKDSTAAAAAVAVATATVSATEGSPSHTIHNSSANTTQKEGGGQPSPSVVDGAVETSLAILPPIKAKAKLPDIPIHARSRLAALHSSAVAGDGDGGLGGGVLGHGGPAILPTIINRLSYSSPLRALMVGTNGGGGGLSPSSTASVGNIAASRRAEWFARPATQLAVHRIDGDNQSSLGGSGQNRHAAELVGAPSTSLFSGGTATMTAVPSNRTPFRAASPAFSRK